MPLGVPAAYEGSDKLAEANAQVHEADNAKNKTAYESFVIEQVRGSIAQASGAYAAAAKSYEAQIASGRVSGAEVRLSETRARRHKRTNGFN